MRRWVVYQRTKKLKITDIFPTGNCTVKVQDKDLVTFEADGYLLDGKKFETGEFQAAIGKDELPKGVEEGLKGLCVGDERSMRIQSEWGHGEKGILHKVPANATVIYDVNVTKIQRDGEERTGLKLNEMLTFKDTTNVECGMKVQGGDTITWRYYGTLSNGKMFDKGDFSAAIDKREVIQGVNEAMKGLCVGGKRNMLMHHSYAYGSRGTSGIPPFANLIFDVYLYSIDRPGFGWESIDTKLRKAGVTSENPIKTTDIIPTGGCEVTARESDKVTWFYHAYTLDGKKFDQGQSDAILGDQKTVPSGLEKAFEGMCVGDERAVTLHPDVAFGEKGLQGKVPINAVVIYDIKIIDITRTISSHEASATGTIDQRTGLKPNQLLKIEITKSVEDCTMQSKEGDTLTWNYIGKFLDGTEFYRGEFKAVLGRGQTIQGVDRGMRDMCVGEKRTLTIHSDWAYGNEGRPGSIPPRATLVFDNELLKIDRPDEVKIKSEEL